MNPHIPPIAPRELSADDATAPLVTTGDVLVPSGEDLSEDASIGLREAGLAMIKAGCLVLVVDLACVRFIDSSGLSALVAIRIAATSAGGGMVLRAPSRSVLRILGITGMLRVFDIVSE
jgi:anti-sigma B factor antagonist